ncbi:MAG: phosphate signaling complex protein PhoU [Deltaproteobacteria bacterium]|nr:phosphate signaling complex protein PhoU [Deltaproteobacteria bacterium]
MTTFATKHTNVQYERELSEVKENIVYAGMLTEKAIEKCIKALLERNSSLANEVIKEDANIDAIDMKIEEQCINILALRQPTARDLRFITTAIKINGHLERIGDMASNIARKVIILNEEPQLKPYIDIPRMAQATRKMIRDGLDAFMNGDMELAREVREADEIIDSLNEQIFRELLTFMIQDPRTIHRAIIISQVSKNLERIADHAKSVADMVIYMVTGQNVRHE